MEMEEAAVVLCAQGTLKSSQLSEREDDTIEKPRRKQHWK